MIRTVLRAAGRSGHRFICQFLGSLCVVAWLTTLSAPAQVVINEVMADNESAVAHGGQFPDYLELHNPSSQAVDLTGASLTDDLAQPWQFAFPAGVSIPAGGYLLVWCDTNAFLPGLRAGFGLSADGELLTLYAADRVTRLDQVSFGLQAPDVSIGRLPNGSGGWVLTQPTPLAANEVQSLGDPTRLRLNEWMALPLAGEDDWIEVYNGDSLPVALGGLVLTDTPSGVPGNRAMPSLSSIGGRGFTRFWASDLDQPDADHLDFKLSSDGEILTLYAADRVTRLDRVSFSGQVRNISQGRAPDGSDNIVFFPAGRATPDEPNFAPQLTVVISEVLTHTDPPLEDAIELHNPTAAPVDVSYWWLSDSGSTPRKYAIPPGTIIPAGGFAVFYQYQFGGGANGFTLNSFDGDDVYLSVGDAAGNLTGEQTFIEFGALLNGVSAGRYRTSVGVDFVPLSGRTFGVDFPMSLSAFRRGTGLANAAPRVGPVVISEIMFHPPDLGGLSNTRDEFVELYNPDTHPVALFDQNYPTNNWRLREGVTFNFPLNVILPAGGYLLVVSFDPQVDTALLAEFRAQYGLTESVPVLGPYDGKLSDLGEGLRLFWPDKPEPLDSLNPGFVPYEVLERIKYASSSPWPAGAGGTGQSLQRRDTSAYGNEPLNWFVSAPTPGRGSVVDSDGDGMPDAWETAHGLNPDGAADAGEDPDADQASNLQEFLAGTEPHDPASVFAILDVQTAQDNLRLSFFAVPGRTYTIQACGRLTADAWVNVTSLGPVATGGSTEVVIPRSPGTGGFHRVVTPARP